MAVLLLSNLLGLLLQLFHLVLDDLLDHLADGLRLGLLLRDCCLRLEVLRDLGCFFDLFLLDVDHLLGVLITMFFLLIVNNCERRIHLHLLQILLHGLKSIEELLGEELAVFYLGSEHLDVLEILEGLGLVERVVLFRAIHPTHLLSVRYVLEALGEVDGPGLEVEELFELELAAPEVVAQTTQVVLAEGGLIEEHFVFVVVDAHYCSVVAEELGAYADYDVSDLMVRWSFFEVQRAQFAESLREEEIRVDDLNLRLYKFLDSFSCLFSLHPFCQKLFLQPYNPLMLHLLGVQRRHRHMSLFFLHQPLVNLHQ